MLLSELVGKRVINLKSALCEGTVIGAYVHKSTYQTPYICLDNDMCIGTDDLFSVGEVITVLSPAYPMEDNLDYYKITSNQEVILASGERLGKVKELPIGGRAKRELTLDKGSVKLKSIVAVSDNIITANPTYRLLDKAKKAPEQRALPQSEKSDYEIILPEELPKKPLGYDFLIGKKVKSEVSDINRSFVLMAGTLITERVIENARKAGKLTDLVNKTK